MKNQLEHIRYQFNEIDKDILALLGARMQLSKRMAKLKKEYDVNIKQESVWKEHLANRMKENVNVKIDSEYLKKIFEIIHEESIRIQTREIEKLK